MYNVFMESSVLQQESTSFIVTLEVESMLILTDTATNDFSDNAKTSYQTKSSLHHFSFFFKLNLGIYCIYLILYRYVFLLLASSKRQMIYFQ